MTDTDQQASEALKAHVERIESRAQREAQIERATSKRFAIHPCDRCGEETPLTLDHVKLMGEYSCRLCNACLNDWQEYTAQNELVRLMGHTQVEYDVALALTQADGVDRADALKYQWDILNETQNRLHALGKAWVTAGYDRAANHPQRIPGPPDPPRSGVEEYG